VRDAHLPIGRFAGPTRSAQSGAFVVVYDRFMARLQAEPRPQTQKTSAEAEVCCSSMDEVPSLNVQLSAPGFVLAPSAPPE
jgi:hypothetical protein